MDNPYDYNAEPVTREEFEALERRTAPKGLYKAIFVLLCLAVLELAVAITYILRGGWS